MSAARPDPLLEQSAVALSQGSRSFAAAAKLLGPEERVAATLIYAWCRHCDDVIDGQVLGHGTTESPEEPVERLANLAVQTRRALRGHDVEDPVFLALQRVVLRHGIPHRYPMELLEGFAMDVANRRYQTLTDTLEYCYHVAGVVGLMMAHIMGVRDELTLDRACDLGIALQLTNIARDVVDDARIGRVYLPLEWLAQEGVEPAAVAEPSNRSAVARVVQRLLDTADAYYASGDVGIRELPFRSAWSIAVARDVYATIGSGVRARGRAAWDERVVVTTARKLRSVVSGFARAAFARGGLVVEGTGSREGLWTRPRDWRSSGDPSQSFAEERNA